MFNVFKFRPLSGFPGVVTRPEDSEVQARIFDPEAVAADVPTNYGFPMKFDGQYLVAFKAGDAASVIAGVLARTAPTISGGLDQTFQESQVNVVTNQNLLVRGYMNVVVNDAAPVQVDSPVYVRSVENLPALVGDFETLSVPGENELVPNYVWNIIGRDENNISEIRVKV